MTLSSRGPAHKHCSPVLQNWVVGQETLGTPETAQHPQLNTKGRSEKKTPVCASHTEMSTGRNWCGRECLRNLNRARDGVLMPGQSAPRDSL